MLDLTAIFESDPQVKQSKFGPVKYPQYFVFCKMQDIWLKLLADKV